jgi:hypothetical protein
MFERNQHVHVNVTSDWDIFTEMQRNFMLKHNNVGNLIQEMKCTEGKGVHI